MLRSTCTPRLRAVFAVVAGLFLLTADSFAFTLRDPPKTGKPEARSAAGTGEMHSRRVTPPHILQVDASANNGDLISPSLCAAACFAATYSFSTVPYFSLDQPRNVTLVYNS